MNGARYANFKDPIGLALRMLRSGSRPARFTLLREALSVVLSPVDLAFQFIERQLVKHSPSSNMPAVFIVGGPRSGTTIVYQTLVKHLDVSYFSNVTAIFPRSPIAATLLFQPLLRPTQNSFENYYGNVSGLSGPNDGFAIWNRWFGTDRTSFPKSITEKSHRELAEFVEAWNVHARKPLLNKNNRNSLGIALIHGAVPNALFIEVTRDPYFVAQSLIESREAVQGKKQRGWGLASGYVDPINEPLGYVDEVVRQVREIHSAIEAGRRSVPAEKYMRVKYGDFCENPSAVVLDAAHLIFGRTGRTRGLESLRPFRNMNRFRLAPAEHDRLSALLHKAQLRNE